jgi:hypothetical protein
VAALKPVATTVFQSAGMQIASQHTAYTRHSDAGFAESGARCF